MSRAARAALVVVATLLSAAIATPGSALAGSYVVTTCSPTPSAGAWTPINTFPGGLSIGNACGGVFESGPGDGTNRGALWAEDILSSSTNVPNGSRAGWTFSAPAGTTITALTYYGSLQAYNDPDMVSGIYRGDGAVLAECKIPWPFVVGSSIYCDKLNQGPVTFTGLNTSSLFLGVICRIVENATACIGGGTIHAARVALYSAKVTLAENSLPAVSGVGGPLWSGGVVSGVVSVTVAAEDETGIRSAVVVGPDVRRPLASVTQTCDDRSVRPCPQLLAGSVSVDTTRVPDGQRTFSVVVTDAAGNARSVVSPPVLVDNYRPPAQTTTATVPSARKDSRRTKMTAVVRNGRLRVTATIASGRRATVRWRSTLRGRSAGHGTRLVRIRKHKLAATFKLGPRARRGVARVTIRVGRQLVARARARRA
jgi:hypothetical protein